MNAPLPDLTLRPTELGTEVNVRPAPPAARPKPRRRRWPYLLALLALGGGAGGWSLSRKKPELIDPALVVSATRASLRIEVIDVGRVEAFEEVEILSKVAGRVKEVRVDDGDVVKPGQPLILLDPRDFARALEREQTLLAAAVAKADFAERSLVRKRELAAEGLAPKADLELPEREARLLALDIATHKVNVAEARDRLNDARILAPSAGTVIRRQIEPGEMVVPGVESSFERSALLTIADLSRLIVKVELNQIDVSKVKLGQRVTATFDGLPGEEFGARVTEIAHASTKAKELDVFPIKAELDRPDPRIRPGMTADVRIHVGEHPDVVTLPLEAVTREGGKAFVKRVVGAGELRHTERVEVALGNENERVAEVVAGLEAGQEVLLDPPSSAANEKAM